MDRSASTPLSEWTTDFGLIGPATALATSMWKSD